MRACEQAQVRHPSTRFRLFRVPPTTAMLYTPQLQDMDLWTKAMRTPSHKTGRKRELRHSRHKAPLGVGQEEGQGNKRELVGEVQQVCSGCLGNQDHGGVFEPPL